MKKTIFTLATALCCCLDINAQATSPAEDAYIDSLLWQYDLNEVVVTGTRVPKLLKETPVQTRLITSSDISKADATNIEDLLQTEMPGVEFSYAMNQQTHLNFSGFGGQSILFLVDGEHMAGETMDDIDFSRLDMNNVERIEIVKGASSALYGSNAGGGVINVITKDATRPWTVSGGVRFARHNEQRYRLNLSASGKHVSNVFSASRNSIDNFNVHNGSDPVTRVVSTIYGNESWVFNDKFTYTPFSGLKLTARAGYFFRELTRVADTPERYRDYSAGLRGVWEINPSNNIEISYSFDQYDKSNFYKLSRLDVRNYSNVQNSFRALYNHSFSNGDILTVGADFMHDYLENSKLADPVHEQDQFDAFAQYDWIVSPQWEVVGAMRYDWFSDGSLSRATPKITVRYKPLRNLNLRFGYGLGFRAPTLKEKYYEFDMAGIWIVRGDPTLKAESSHNFNLSADYTYRHFNFTLTAYYNDIRNRISSGLPYYLPGDDSQLYLNYVNLSGYTVAGGELSVQGRWGNGLSAKVSYALTDEHLAKNKDGKTANNQYIPARKHSLTARIDWEKNVSKNFGFNLSLNGRYLSGVDNIEYKDYYNIDAGTTEVHYPAYTLWKLSATMQIKKRVKVSLALDNLFNYKPEYYYLNCPLTDGTNFMAGISFEFYK
ncbi:MAG: TonB-dependent receptor [Prevotellaceae bacterium]|nr:TonB-dependent receptor [Prevotellaceae bacterium]